MCRACAAGIDKPSLHTTAAVLPNFSSSWHSIITSESYNKSTSELKPGYRVTLTMDASKAINGKRHNQGDSAWKRWTVATTCARHGQQFFVPFLFLPLSSLRRRS